MLNIIVNILSNYIVKVSAVSWMIAQTIKIIIYYIVHKEVSLERIFGAGGMPSSHSALVCSTCIATYKQCGPDSAIFAISVILAGIVMYDAMGVRRAAGEQAKVINKIIIDPIKKDMKDTDNNIFENITIKTLKELLGHTPLEVLGGAVLGIGIALFF